MLLPLAKSSTLQYNEKTFNGSAVVVELVDTYV